MFTGLLQTKWPPFCRHLQIHVIVRNISYLDSKFAEDFSESSVENGSTSVIQCLIAWWWLVAWWHQPMTRTIIYLSSSDPGIRSTWLKALWHHPRVLDIQNIVILCLKFTHSKSQHLPGVTELKQLWPQMCRRHQTQRQWRPIWKLMLFIINNNSSPILGLMWPDVSGQNPPPTHPIIEI